MRVIQKEMETHFLSSVKRCVICRKWEDNANNNKTPLECEVVQTPELWKERQKLRLLRQAPECRTGPALRDIVFKSPAGSRMLKGVRAHLTPLPFLWVLRLRAVLFEFSVAEHPVVRWAATDSMKPVDYVDFHERKGFFPISIGVFA